MLLSCTYTHRINSMKHQYIYIYIIYMCVYSINWIKINWFSIFHARVTHIFLDVLSAVAYTHCTVVYLIVKHEQLANTHYAHCECAKEDSRFPCQTLIIFIMHGFLYAQLILFFFIHFFFLFIFHSILLVMLLACLFVRSNQLFHLFPLTLFAVASIQFNFRVEALPFLLILLLLLNL